MWDKKKGVLDKHKRCRQKDTYGEIYMNMIVTGDLIWLKAMNKTPFYTMHALVVMN